MKYARILATGAYLPEKIVTNLDLEKTVETSDEWIQQRTGIQHRHVASANENTATMATEAAKRALETADIDPASIDMIIAATCTADQVFPSTACLVQTALGVPACPAFDVQAACSGFMYALSIAVQFIQQRVHKRILLLGTEAMSKVMDWSDRSTCVLFGDGAGAVVLEASDEPGVLSTLMGADGQYRDLLYLNNAKMFNDSNIRMEGNAVFRLAVKHLGEMAWKVIKDNQLSTQDIDWIVPHQANIRIIKATAKKLDIPMDKVVVTVGQHANTSGASIPLALDVAIRDGRIQRGQHLLLEAFGGGLTWGAALVRY